MVLIFDAKDHKAKAPAPYVLANAKLPAEFEVHAGTKHGAYPTDSPGYDHDHAEKAWGRKLALFDRSLEG
jgi:carboxymethylenebutenolidase